MILMMIMMLTTMMMMMMTITFLLLLRPFSPRGLKVEGDRAARAASRSARRPPRRAL